MARIVMLTREDCYCKLITFYENVAKKLSFKATDKTEFDCRKICVSKSVQEAIWAYYREQETIVGSNMATLWALCGPKADVEGKNKLFVVSVESGFILPR